MWTCNGYYQEANVLKLDLCKVLCYNISIASCIMLLKTYSKEDNFMSVTTKKGIIIIINKDNSAQPENWQRPSKKNEK